MNLKYILSFVAFATLTVTSYAQVIYNYNELGTLFSKDDNKGTARFNGMSGAFGALGGDISSITINPAGAAISKLSNIAITGTYSNLEYATNYYGETINNDSDNFKIPQIGGMLVFSNGKKSNWNRTALYFNYRNKTNFNTNYEISGNSGELSTNLLPEEENLFASRAQTLVNDVSGKSSVFNIGFSTVHKDKLFLGAALKFHQLEFSQTTTFSELHDGLNGAILDFDTYTESYITGNGVSFNIGFIYKLNKNFRLGLSYETPTIYSEIIEDYYDELIIFEGDNNPEGFESDGDLRSVYRFKSPNRITASGAFIFGKKGLISADFTHKNYSRTSYDSDGFSDTNLIFENEYRDTYNLNIGTEWRFDNVSIRGGASYEKNPNLIQGGSVNKDNIKGFSLGLGYNFGNAKFDLSYNNSENVDYYMIYEASDLSIDKNLSQISGTFTFNL